MHHMLSSNIRLMSIRQILCIMEAPSSMCICNVQAGNAVQGSSKHSTRPGKSGALVHLVFICFYALSKHCPSHSGPLLHNGAFLQLWYKKPGPDHLFCNSVVLCIACQQDAVANICSGISIIYTSSSYYCTAFSYRNFLPE